MKKLEIILKTIGKKFSQQQLIATAAFAKKQITHFNSKTSTSSMTGLVDEYKCNILEPSQSDSQSNSILVESVKSPN